MTLFDENAPKMEH